jgi:hypothetical protein
MDKKQTAGMSLQYQKSWWKNSLNFNSRGAGKKFVIAISQVLVKNSKTYSCTYLWAYSY